MNAPYPNDDPGHTPATPAASPVESVRLDQPRDLLAAIPYLLGFHPGTGSLIAVAISGGRVGVTVRVDAARLGPDDMPAVWARLARPLAEADARHLLVVGYLPETDQDLLAAFAAACPTPVLDVIRVDDGRWWSLTCPNGPDCCPPGQPVREDPAVVAPLIAAAGAPAASRADLAACLRPGPAEAVSAVAGLLPLNPVPPPAALYRALADAHAGCVDGPIRLVPDRAALLLQAVTDLRIRDAACVWHDDAAWWLWTTLIRYAPPTHLPPVTTLIATTAYQRGDTVLARMAAEHALTANPDYGLAQLMLGTVAAQIHPATIRDVFAGALAELADLPAYRQLGLTTSGQPTRPGNPHPSNDNTGHGNGDGDG
jgi:hypothetical protein